MAQWTQTLEPYIRVHEEVKSMALNPTAGEDLIIGVTFISDAGPSTPTLIRGQKEFLETYTSQDLTQDYIESLNQLYTGDDSTLSANMWANAYRLAGSNTLLAVRASKADGMYFAKPLDKDDTINNYLLRDGELLKRVPSFKLVLDDTADNIEDTGDGWLISISGVGAFGNRIGDEGVMYDYFVNDLPSLVDSLNDTSKFFSPSYKFYAQAEQEQKNEIVDIERAKREAKVVVFEEVYLGSMVLDVDDDRTEDGLAYIITCEPNWYPDPQDPQTTINLNDTAYSGFMASEYYATNVYNSATQLGVRIRRFNHDAVVSRELSSSDKATLNKETKSPYSVLKDVLDIYTGKGTKPVDPSILERDFFEIAVYDPSINGETSFFNVGNILGRGDMEVSEVNELIKMIQLNLPDDLHDLGLNYYDYVTDNYIWKPTSIKNESMWTEVGAPPTTTGLKTVQTVDDLWKESFILSVADEEFVIVTTGPNGSTTYYQYSMDTTVTSIDALYEIEDPTENQIETVKTATSVQNYIYSVNGENQIYADLTINPTESKILSVSDSDFKKAMDKILEDEVYTTEGLCDLGNTELSFQNYLANMAISEDGNYFYPISTVNSTNYMTIGNSATKISQDSYKLYMSAPWDIDTGTLGWKFYASPSVLYWESVARNRRNNNEFASIIGQNYGLMQYQRPVTEFNKKTRQLLLSRRVNTVLWNTSTNSWNQNDCYTKQNENNIMSEDGNSRLMIRISKAMPVILRQFIGRKITEPMCAEVRGVIDYWFRTTIIPMNITVDAYQIFCDYDEALARQNKIKVVVQARYSRSLKFIDCYNVSFDVGMDISSPAR